MFAITSERNLDFESLQLSDCSNVNFENHFFLSRKCNSLVKYVTYCPAGVAGNERFNCIISECRYIVGRCRVSSKT